VGLAGSELDLLLPSLDLQAFGKILWLGEVFLLALSVLRFDPSFLLLPVGGFGLERFELL
jgi:hypothetical protein